MRRIGRFDVAMLPVLAITLFVAFLLVVTTAKPVAGVTENLPNDRILGEIYVHQINPSTNYSNKTYMYVGRYGTPTAGAERGYVKYDLSGISGGSTITSAKLWLWQWYTGNPSGNVQIEKVDDDSWSETVVTWDTQPARSGFLASTLVNATNAWFSWSSAALTAFVKSQYESDKVVSLAIIYPGENTTNVSFGFDTRRYTTNPALASRLELTYSAPSMSINITPSTQTGTAGSTLSYTVTVGNSTGSPATFNLTVDNKWVTSLPSTVGPISDGGTGSVTLAVTCPTARGFQDTIKVTATCQGSPGITANNMCTAITPPFITVADAFVNEQTPTFNMGTAKTVVVGTQLYNLTSLENCRGYWKLDLSDIPYGATIDNARFKAYTAFGGENGGYPTYGDATLTVTLKGVPDAGWDESTINWNNKPAMGSSLGSVVVPPTNYLWYSWDVTSFVASQIASGFAMISFGMVSVNEGINVFVPWTAKEDTTYWVGQESQLIIQYHGGGGTPGVNVSISPTSKSGLSGSTLTYTVTVTNTGTASGTYTLTKSESAAPSWSPSLSKDTVGPLAPGASDTAQLSVTIPAGTAEGASDNVRVTAAGTGASAQSSCIAIVGGGGTPGVNVSISPTSKSGTPGSTLTYTVTVTNTGSVQNTYNLTTADNASPSWNPTISPTSLSLAAGASGTATLSVAIPSGAQNGASDNVRVTAAGTGASAQSSCIAIVGALSQVEVSISPTSKSGLSGSTLTYTVTVTNTGTASGTYTLTKSDSAASSWPSSLSKISVGPLAPGASGTAQLSVTIPAGTAEGVSHTITVTATSATTDDASCVVLALGSPRPIFWVGISPGSRENIPGGTLRYFVTVTNMGNVTDDYTLSATDTLGWSLTLPSSIADVARNEDRTVTLTVGIPDNAADNDSSTITVTATSSENTEVKYGASCTARCATADATSITISPSRFALFPGYSGQVQSLTATLRVGNNPLPNKQITWSVTAGAGSVSPSSGTTDALGRVYVVYTAPAVTAGTPQVTITASFNRDNLYQASSENSLGIPATQVIVNISSAGGTVVITVIEINVTVNLLVVPQNALFENTAITVAQAPRESISNYKMVSHVFNVGPSGTTFVTPSTLTLPYDENELPVGVSEDNLAIYRRTSGGGWERLGGDVDKTEKTVSVQIDHLSEYAVMASTGVVVGGGELPLLTIGVIIAVILIIAVIAIFIRRR
jgi:uncharacterized membrane protein